MSLTIATWNVNSIRARESRLLDWLRRREPDIVCLQELKVVSDKFPYDTVRDAGYHAAVFGQKAYNGVAVLSRHEPTDVRIGFGDSEDEDEARFITATFPDLSVMSAYFPNGRAVGTEHFVYKLDWMRRLAEHLRSEIQHATPIVLAGDFNVAPDDLDVANPDKWGASVLCHESARDALERIRTVGLVDVFRQHHPEGAVYSWWDYQLLGFPKNDGLRIDHIFATPELAARSASAWVDREERKGHKPSDHAPVFATFS